MPLEKIVKLEPGRYYHIYNRGNNRAYIFFEERNYDYFLDRYRKYITGIADTFAFCLLRNHFHLLVRLKTEEHCLQKTSSSHDPVNLSKPFSDFFNSYTKAINKACYRTGGLFEGPFRRIEVDTDEYLIQLLLYIHLNPQRHGIVKDFEKYPHTSYRLLISDGDTFLKKEEVLDWFGSKESYVQAHRSYRDESHPTQLVGDDS
jgi:REP element-mobilizing transposase RayT